jgi:hypothetical protein
LEKTRTLDAGFLDKICKYLESNGLMYPDVLNDAVGARKAGKVFELSDHLRGLVYSLLSNQTPWRRIVSHLPEIDALFFNYDANKVKNAGGDYFAGELFKLKCGNRKTSDQMDHLRDNIIMFEKISKLYGSMDAFVTSRPAYEIVPMLSKATSQYKLKEVGEALAWEYLRNVGIDGAKPDLHLKRIFGAERLGASDRKTAAPDEIYSAVKQLSHDTGISMARIDNIIWSYCATGYGEICTAAPKCNICVIKQYCKHSH